MSPTPPSFQTEWWSIEIPPGWTAVQHPECATLQANPPVGALQISAVQKLEGTVSDRELEEFASDVLRETRKEPVQYGSFAGFKVSFLREEVYWQMWWLSHQNLMLYATYNVKRTLQAKETEVVEGALRSLRPL